MAQYYHLPNTKDNIERALELILKRKDDLTQKKRVADGALVTTATVLDKAKDVVKNIKLDQRKILGGDFQSGRR